MEVINIKLVPWEVVIILLEDISKPIIISLANLVLLLNLHIIFQLNNFFISVISTGMGFFVLIESDLRRVMMYFLVDLFMGICSHKLEVLVGADHCHLVIKIHLFYFKNFIHNLNQKLYTFFSWLLQRLWSLDIGIWGKFLGMRVSMSLGEIWKRLMFSRWWGKICLSFWYAIVASIF